MYIHRCDETEGNSNTRALSTKRVFFGCKKVERIKVSCLLLSSFVVQELCESRGGRPGLSVLTSLLVSVDVNNY